MGPKKVCGTLALRHSTSSFINGPVKLNLLM